ncbi:MAG TPA: TadE/TadG family type IV pilus assembly protein [Dehalococcoidia bacterium]
MFGRLIHKKGKGERGQSMVEFALIVPLFLLLMFAIVDFGMGFYSWITVTNAAREGARIGAVGADSATITQKVKDTVGPSLNNSNLTISVSNAKGNPVDPVVVTVNYQYTLITPLSSLIHLVSGGSMGPNINFSSTSQMRLE